MPRWSVVIPQWSRLAGHYFSSKAEAVAARHLDRMLLIAAGLRDRPPGEPLWDAITGAVLSQFIGGQPHSRPGPTPSS